MVQRDFGSAIVVQEVQMTAEYGLFLIVFSATTVQYWCRNTAGISATSPMYIGEVLALIALAPNKTRGNNSYDKEKINV